MGETFKEIQRYRKWWMILIVLLLLVLPFVSVYQQIILGKPFGNNPASDGLLLLLASFMILIALLLLRVSLKTDVGWDGITMHYAPFFKKQILWSQISSAKIVDYGFLGGWGFRYSKKHGIVYNISGRMGIQIVLTSNQKFVIGTQRPDEFMHALKTYIPNLEPQWVDTKNP